MTLHRPTPDPYEGARQRWLEQFFSAKAAIKGGVVRRSMREVERSLGRTGLELEVRKRGYHLLLCGGQFIVICDPDPVQSIC